MEVTKSEEHISIVSELLVLEWRLRLSRCGWPNLCCIAQRNADGLEAVDNVNISTTRRRRKHS